MLLGGCIWWVTRRLYGNLGGYTALALYCFSPAVLKACVAPNPEVLAALGVFGGVYTCIGVAHAMQGPRRKWRPRIILLTVIFGVAAAAHIAALPVAALLGLAAMLWIAEGHRSQTLPVVLVASVGALLLVFACYGFSPDAFSYRLPFLRGIPLFLPRSRAPLLLHAFKRRRHRWPPAPPSSCILPRASRATSATPFLCSARLVLILLVMTGAPGTPWLWALPFLLTFVGGVFADAYEGPRGKLALAAGGAIVLAQAVLCVLEPPSLVILSAAKACPERRSRKRSKSNGDLRLLFPHFIHHKHGCPRSGFSDLG